MQSLWSNNWKTILISADYQMLACEHATHTANISVSISSQWFSFYAKDFILLIFILFHFDLLTTFKQQNVGYLKADSVTLYIVACKHKLGSSYLLTFILLEK